MTGLVIVELGREKLYPMRDGESPGDGEQENERQAKDDGRWPRGSDGEARRGDGGARTDERLVQPAVAVTGLLACGYQHRRAEHDGGARGKHPCRSGWGAAVVGVVDEADHRGAHRGDGGGEWQVA